MEDEFELEILMVGLHKAGADALAANVEGLILSLTAMPPLWKQAEKFASEIAALGDNTRSLESLRNVVIRALSPLLDDLPATMGEMRIALGHSGSTAANAFAAARIIRIFGNEFDPH
ncbi:hypothetical protein [Hyphomicrobium sp.]|uniref:hypothetical protein n=1 Tax=Hyphomicrobium sp. TaxID=82 RepID=UPI0035669E0A